MPKACIVVQTAFLALPRYCTSCMSVGATAGFMLKLVQVACATLTSSASIIARLMSPCLDIYQFRSQNRAWDRLCHHNTGMEVSDQNHTHATDCLRVGAPACPEALIQVTCVRTCVKMCWPRHCRLRPTTSSHCSPSRRTNPADQHHKSQ